MLFSDEITGLPPQRDVDFYIELHPGTSLISRTSHRIAPVELQELKVQIQELQDKRFVRPSTSSWGALVFFFQRRRTRSFDYALTIDTSTGLRSRIGIHYRGLMTCLIS